MLYVRLEAKESKIHGIGCFSRQAIKKRTILSFWGDEREVRVFSKMAHKNALKKKSRVTVETAVRLMGDTFVESNRIEEKDPTDYINHSLRPNVGYFAGLLFALKNIGKGDELFLDYRLLNAEYETNVVKGLSARRQLQASAKQIAKTFG